jgi:tripartite ATP-independent transporter DctM subunit
MDVLILIGSFTVTCLAGMPVAYALGLAAILAALWTGIPLEAVMLKVSGGMSGFSLLAIPFFILAGAIMAVGGMAERLVNLAKVFVGFIRGGMALVNIVASTLFGCISGSSVADTAAVGSVMIPQMIRHGYPRLFAVNVTISGSLQPLLLPPSHNMIIYSLAAGGTVSVAQLFMGGIIPALLLGLSLIALVLVIAHRENFPKGEIVPPRQALKIAVDAIWGLITIVIILGGILSGIFTPTESAAVACVYAFFVTMFVYRDCKWSELPQLIARVVRTVGMVMIMIGFSIAFGYMMALMQIPAKATEFFVAVSSDKYTFLLYVNVLLLLLGHGSGADAADLHPDLPARDQNFRHRPRAFRHRDDPQSRHRAAHAAGRSDHGGGMRDRPREHGSGVAQHPGLLHSHAGRARARHLCARTVAVAATVAVEVTKSGEVANGGCYSE